MIYIETSDTYQLECHYILSVIFENFLGLDIKIQWSDREDTRIHIDHEHELVVSDGLFTTLPDQWLQPTSLPKQPLPIWNFATTGLSATTLSSKIPVIYGNDPKAPSFFQCSENKIYLGLDIFGSAFFMLTRYEEIVKTERDEHDRFPATASLAYQENFLHRPIVNEYVEILWACLKKLWPQLERKQKHFKIRVTHDVDIPYKYTFAKFPQIVRNITSTLFKRFSFKQAMLLGQVIYFAHKGNVETDPFNTFDWLMKLSDQYNITSAFYFITDRTDPNKDGKYTFNHPLIRKLLKCIHQRGHEIGLHPSFNSYLDAWQIQKEYKILRQVCSEEEIDQKIWGGRQHFLRWNNPQTWQCWEDAGLNYDSTLSFADIAGFRCGTCYEFPVFNLITRQTLNLIERPLIIMECTVLDNRYMGLGKNFSKAFDLMKNLKDSCRRFDGTFTLLWHNSRFEVSDERELYQEILRA